MTSMDFCLPPVPNEKHEYYGDTHIRYVKLACDEPAITAPVARPVKKNPDQRPAQTLHVIAESGNLERLRLILKLIQDPLKAVNDQHPSTKRTPLYFAAAHGHLKIVQCLVEEYSVSVDAFDKEGETALLKAAHEGHYHVVNYLQQKNANIHHKDKDGWTALHNACSKGQLPIVELLVSRGAKVNQRSKVGHTPLMNAASRGFISIVEYLLKKAGANPRLRNEYGESAYDVSAMAGEPYICELLDKASKAWPEVEEQDRPLSDVAPVRTIMFVLHENQRSSSLLGFPRPQFHHNAHTIWTEHPSGKITSRESIRLEHDWFWLTDWQIDYSHPMIDPTSGWQYAHSFKEPDEAWTPVAPSSGYGWVRRRRWVRSMKRRNPLGAPDYLRRAKEIIQAAAQATENDGERDGTDSHAVSRLTRERRAYEEALQELHAGIDTDDHKDQKKVATRIAKAYASRIKDLDEQISTLAPQIATPISPIPHKHNPELARELGFTVSSPSKAHTLDQDEHHPATPDDGYDVNPWSRDGGPMSSGAPVLWPENESVDLVGGAALYRGDSLTETEADGPRAFAWESDMESKECRRCSRRFGLLVRRHHCRRCGLIVCDRCSASRAYLSLEQILQDPNGPRGPSEALASHHQRVCDKCYADLGMNI